MKVLDNKHLSKKKGNRTTTIKEHMPSTENSIVVQIQKNHIIPLPADQNQ